MPLGIVNDEEWDQAIKPVAKAEIIDIKRGRDSNAVPQSLRKIISEESLEGTRAKKLSEVFDVSESSISAYKVGATSTSSYHNPSEELQSYNNSIKQHIAGEARRALSSSLKNITDDKLAVAKLRDIASVARDMSAVLKNIEPEITVNQQQNNMVFYTPRLKTEADFEEIILDD